MLPTFWYSHPVYSPLLECGLDPATHFQRIGYSRNDGMSLLRTGYKGCSFHLGYLLSIPLLVLLLVLSILLLVLLSILLLASILCTALWKGTRGKELRQPLDNSPQESEALSPVAFEEMNPATNHLSELGSRSFGPSEP